MKPRIRILFRADKYFMAMHVNDVDINGYKKSIVNFSDGRKNLILSKERGSVLHPR